MEILARVYIYMYTPRGCWWCDAFYSHQGKTVDFDVKQIRD